MMLEGNLSPGQKQVLLENKSNPYFQALLQSYEMTQDLKDLEENIKIFVAVQNIKKPTYDTISELI